MNDKGMIAPFLASSLVIVFKPGNKSHYKLMKDQNSNRKNDFLITTIVPVTLYSNILIFRDTNESFDIDGDLLKTMANDNFNVGHCNPQDQ